MSHLSLPALSPSDPENLLSRESRQRIQAAYMAAELIRTQALSRLETRYRAEPSLGIGFAECLSTGTAFVDLTESTMEAARTVLRVEEAEYRELGLPASRFREIMRQMIEAAVNSLELSNLQKQELDLAFVWATLHNSNRATTAYSLRSSRERRRGIEESARERDDARPFPIQP